MGNQIHHRGPDDEQSYRQDNVGIIFKRLSIVDVAGGKQPFTSEDGSVLLVVNGEIYNYQALIKLLKEKNYKVDINELKNV